MQFEQSLAINWFNSENSEDCTVYLTSRGNIVHEPGREENNEHVLYSISTSVAVVEGTLRARNWGPLTTTTGNKWRLEEAVNANRMLFELSAVTNWIIQNTLQKVPCISPAEETSMMILGREKNNGHVLCSISPSVAKQKGLDERDTGDYQ